MSKQTYQRYSTPRGVAMYPHLTEPDTKFKSEGEYHCKLRVSAADAADFIAKLEAIRDEFYHEYDMPAAKKKKARVKPVVEEELDDDGNETGNVIIKVTMKARVTTKAGKSWDQAPVFFDSKGSKFEPEALWSGSELKLAGDVVPYMMASTTEFGVSLRLKAVQVLKLVQGGGADAGAFGFGEEDGFAAETAESNGFGPESDGDEDPDF